MMRIIFNRGGDSELGGGGGGGFSRSLRQRSRVAVGVATAFTLAVTRRSMIGRKSIVGEEDIDWGV